MGAMPMIIFAHGMEGSPNGSKIRSLRNAGFEVLAPNFQGMPLEQRVNLLQKVCEQQGEKAVVLAGSSYGGLAASIVAMRMPDAFRGLLLCAPALHLDEPPIDNETVLIAPKGMRTAIIHGIDDDIVPLSCSIEYAERSRDDIVVFNQVKDGHRLAESHNEIISAAKLLIGETIDS